MKCQQVSEEGQQCRAYPMDGSHFCYFHNPEISDNEKKAAQSKGGKARGVKVETPLPSLKIQRVEDVTHLLEDTVNQLRAGAVDVKYANCVSILSGQLIRSLEVSQVASKIELIKRAVCDNGSTYNAL